MKDLIPTILSASSGTIATAIAVNQDVVMYYVSLVITVATTIFNFILFCKKKWKESESNNWTDSKKEGDKSGDTEDDTSPRE